LREKMAREKCQTNALGTPGAALQADSGRRGGESTRRSPPFYEPTQVSFPVTAMSLTFLNLITESRPEDPGVQGFMCQGGIEWNLSKPADPEADVTSRPCFRHEFHAQMPNSKRS
jgi:hypothetical protein